MWTELLSIMKIELLICILIFALLFIKISGNAASGRVLLIVRAFLLILFFVSLLLPESGSIFNNMFKSNTLIHFQKSLLIGGVFLMSLLFTDWYKGHTQLVEFFVLVLSSLLGMMFLVSSGNFLMLFLALELTTIPVAALSNFDLEKRISSEAAMKMILSSALSSGVLLFGLSILYGLTGTLDFTAFANNFNASNLSLLAFIFFISAFAFKLSIVPFHLWTADTYEGSPIAVSAYLSVISKGAVAFIFMTLLFEVFKNIEIQWHTLLMVLSLLTMVVGNIFAVRQQNIKRFLAYSSIAQVGFILTGILGGKLAGATAVNYFILVYILSNMATFGIASIISVQSGKENIRDYNGLYKNNRFISWVMAIALFSLAGIPPLAGFFGKFYLIAAGAATTPLWYILLVTLNMIISLYYYLRIVRAIFMEKAPEGSQQFKLESSVQIGLMLCAVGLVLTGILTGLYNYIAGLVG